MLSSYALRVTGRRLALLGLAAVLGLVALGFLLASLFLGLLQVVEPAWAALITAAVAAVLAAIIILVANRRRVPPPRAAQPLGLTEQVAPALQLAVGSKPWLAIGLALALGAFSELARKPPRPPRR
jgi:hypothetical protein